MIARSADTAALFEERLFEPDIARSHPGKPPTGVRDAARELALGQAHLLPVRSPARAAGMTETITGHDHISDDVRQGANGRERCDGRALHARGRPVPDDARQLGHERLDRDGGEGRRHDRDRDPGRDHRVHARDGGADDHRRQDRGDHRPQAGVRDRLRDLRLRLVHHLDLPEPAVAALRLVVPGGRRCGADPARDRRARRRELPGRAPARRLRPGRRRGRDRGRGRAADRRLLHDVLLLALGLRR